MIFLKTINSHYVRSAVCILLLTISVVSTNYAQQQVGLSQQIYVLKLLKPEVKTIGVMTSTMSTKDFQEITRLGLAHGLEFVFAKAESPQDISSLYQQMVATKKIKLIWLPDNNDEIMLGVGFQFLRENTLLDKIGLCTPKKLLVESGALCSVQKEEGKVVVYLNKRNAELLSINIPASDANSTINFIVR